MSEEQKKPVRIGAVIGRVFAAIIGALFLTDLVCVKLIRRPPVFCAEVISYENGMCTEYCGAGYKILRDYDVRTDSENYYVTLWILPMEYSV